MKLILLVLFSLSLSGQLAWADPADDLQNEKKLSQEYLSKMSQEVGAQVIDEGVVIRPIFTADSQNYAQLKDLVLVSYHLASREGALIEESVSSDMVLSFPLGKLIKCWQLAVPKIAFGSFYKVTCPSDTAYGDKGSGPIKPGAALTFRIFVFGIAKK